MTTINELLDEASEIVLACEIDSDTREISVPDEYRFFGVESDENVRRIRFRCNKIVDNNINLTDLNLYINYSNANEELNVYAVDDVTVDGDYITFSWLLSRNVTKYPGTVTYIVCAKKTEGDEIITEWNTKVASGVVESGLEATETVKEIYTDVIDQMIKNINALPGSEELEEMKSSVAGLTNKIVDLESDIADLKYVAIKITAISNTVGTVELGRTITAITINWSVNKNPKSQTVDGVEVDATIRSKTLTDLAVTANKSFRVSVTDERGAKHSASTGISFLNGVYCGTLTDGTEIDSAAVLKLTRRLQGSRGVTFTANAGTTDHIVYAFPTRYGTPTFKVGGFEGGFSKASTFDFTNASGYTESYDVWLSDNTGLGSTTVGVS